MKTAPSNRPPRLLVVDDNPAIHEDFHKILIGQPAANSRLGAVEKALFGGGPLNVERVPFRIDPAYQGQEALALVMAALEAGDPYVMAFVDVRMPPGWDGVETLEHIWQCCPELQAVICTAYSDYSWDDIIRRLGQSDNLLILKKPFETVEVLQITHALARKWELGRQAKLRVEDLDRMVCERTQELQLEVAERTRVQEALRISEERFSKAFQSNPIPMAIQSQPEGRFLAANASFYALAGYDAGQILQRTGDELKLLETDTEQRAAATKTENRLRSHPCLLRRADGAPRNVVLWTEPITLDAGPCLLVIVEDVTEQLKLEAQLRQSQKMEIVGRLTAGIAHEFNNLLTVIQGHAGLLRDRPAGAPFAAESVERIVQASQRAASFTAQLLSFSRKQPLQLKPVNLATVLPALQKMLVLLIGERHELKLAFEENLPPVRANDGNVEQILINLAVNARDAMPEGGVIHVSATAAVFDEATARRQPETRPGRFVCLTVTDAGCGINAGIMDRIFDPFFTTKEVGKGTGLGLSTIQSLVRQHQGWIEVASQVDQGSTFKIYLPVWEGAAPFTLTKTAAAAAAADRGSGETVLVVEDDAAVRELARVALEDGGYQVFEAADGRHALQVWEQRLTNIDLLVTDMVMPKGVSGGTLAKILQSEAPGLRVIYTSGYNRESIHSDLPPAGDTHFLAKPYHAQSLLQAVKRCLDSQPAPGPGIDLRAEKVLATT